MVPPSDLHELLIRSVVDYAIFMLDPEGRVVSWSPGAERIKGYAADEIIGEHFSRFYTDEDRTAGIPKAALAQAAETGRFTTEAWRVRKDGSRFWAMVVIDPIRQDGKLIGFVKITRDMTEQHNAQLAALESERKFRLLVQGVTDYAIYMLDPKEVITNWNTGAARIFLCSTRPKIVRLKCRRGRLSGRPATAATSWKGGAAARTVLSSGPMPLLTPFAIRTASFSVLPRSPAISPNDARRSWSWKRRTNS